MSNSMTKFVVSFHAALAEQNILGTNPFCTHWEGEQLAKPKVVLKLWAPHENVSDIRV